MPRYKLTIEYDGRPFVGWQRQDNGPSVQAALERAFAAFCGETPAVVGAGRTDAGVHALAMAAHVELGRDWRPGEIANALNFHLRPDPVSVLDVKAAADDFHARFSCTGRAYLYRIVNRRPPLTLDSGLAWQVKKPLDAAAMHRAAQILAGRHDFTTFRSAQCQSASPVKTLDVLTVERHGEAVEIYASARSFLHHQVRSMVGTLSLVGLGKWTDADLRAALQARDRAALGLNAPPDGLYFIEARYGD